MVRVTRVRRRPLLVQSHDETDTESSSTEEEEEEDEEGRDVVSAEGLDDQDQQGEARFKVRYSRRISGKDNAVISSVATNEKSKGKASVPITLKKICKVCKGTGHQAGFQGATYIDCPKKPCFLCKMPGHTTISCPHRVAMEHGVIPSPRRNAHTSLDYVFQRQLLANHIPKIKPAFVIPNRLVRGVIKFHSRRVTCLEFHPTRNGILLSGDKLCPRLWAPASPYKKELRCFGGHAGVTDQILMLLCGTCNEAWPNLKKKKGQLGIWDYEKLHEKTIYGSIHSCILNNMKFNPHNDGMLFTSSSDGTVYCIDLETGMPSLLMDLNPNGWNGPANWQMLYGLDVNPERGILFVADNFGSLYLVDTRSKKQIGKSVLIHKKGTKVVGLHCNPVQPDILLSCGNDHFARIWDARHLEDGSSLSELAHGRVVNSAYFSPLTGSKILSTSQDNRIRVWDSIFRDLQCPSREIIHSHDFNRHLTPFRAEWDPKDPSESLAVIGRYISENINGIALHPIDFVDTATGQLVAEVTEPEIPTISPVNKLHPRENILASGSSRSVFIWRPEMDTDSESLQKEHQERSKQFVIRRTGKKKSGDKFDGGSDDDDSFYVQSKKLKAGKGSRKFKC